MRERESPSYQRHIIIWTERAQLAGGTGLDIAEEDDPGEFHSTGSFCKVAFLELKLKYLNENFTD